MPSDCSMGYERSFHQAVGVEAASKMIDLMQHEAGHTMLEAEGRS